MCRVTVLQNSWDASHTVLGEDGHSSRTTARDRTRRRLARGRGWPARLSGRKQTKLFSIFLPSLAGGVSGKGDEQKPEGSQHTPPSSSPLHTQTCRVQPTTQQSAIQLRSKTCVLQVLSPSLDTCSCLSSLDATSCLSQDWCPPPLPSARGHGQQAQREPCEHQQDCTAFLLQGNPSSRVHSTRPMIPAPARLTLPASLSFCAWRGALSWPRCSLQSAPQWLPSQTRSLRPLKV